MAGKVTYYRIEDAHSTPEDPAGVLRRTVGADGEPWDMAFRRALHWHLTNEYAGTEDAADLVEITEGEALGIVDAMRRGSSFEVTAGGTATSKPTPADLGINVAGLRWGRSGEGDGAIEIAFPESPARWNRGDWVLMRVAGDSDDRILVFDRNEWACFLDGVRNGEFDDAAAL